jgi:DNA-binding transcriptional ArsR family regulator
MKKVVLLQEPSFLWDLYFVFYLRFNFKTIFKEPFPNKDTEEFATACKNTLVRFGSFPDELAIFFKKYNRTESTFISDKYLKCFEKNFVKEYNIDFLQQELSDHNEVVLRMLSFYFEEIEPDKLEECLASKEKLFEHIKKSKLSMEEKVNLYEFFMTPMQYILTLQRTLIEKRAILADFYKENYKKIVDAYDQIAVNELNSRMNISEDALLEGYVSYCLIDKFHFDLAINSQSYLYILGNEYEYALEKTDRTARSSVESFCYAFCEKNRVDILRLIRERGEVTCKDLERHFRFSGSTAYHHLSLLSRAGILKTRNEGKAIFYSINKEYIRQMRKSFDEFL